MRIRCVFDGMPLAINLSYSHIAPNIHPGELMPKHSTHGSIPWTFSALTLNRWDDFESLFGVRGACGGCWCMWWRSTHAEYAADKGDRNRQRMRRLVESGVVPGIIAYSNGVPVGWCALAPRSEFVRLEYSRILSPIDDRPVWSIVCFFVAKPFRERGLTRALIDAALAFAKEHGAEVVESYPVDPLGGKKADAFMYTGIASTFANAGFTEAARRSATRPIMRKKLRAGKRKRDD
jgi:GNAT superfamily N-acetyltransferase